MPDPKGTGRVDPALMLKGSVPDLVEGTVLKGTIPDLGEGMMLKVLYLIW